MKKFDSFGIMLDCSRNAVTDIPELKRFIDVIAAMGYDQLQLYTEDTYEVDGEPLFGHFRGRYTQKELMEIDEYAAERGVELVPCIQTLAHLNAIFRWGEYAKVKDVDDILLVGSERTYKLIDNMFSTLRKCFRTNKLHIGMDEAHMLGRGRYKTLNGERDKFDILLEHLNKVCDLAAKYNFEPMMWSDMFFRLAAGGQYYISDAAFDDSIKEKIPKNVSLVYWDYYSKDRKRYADMIEGHKKLCDKIIFAGGAWRWAGFAPHNAFSIPACDAAVTECELGGIKDVFITMWGDNGGETSPYAMLPTLCHAACAAQGITDIKEIKAKFLEWTGCNYDTFMLLDLPDRTVKSEKVINTSKYKLYNDCFMGIFDSTVVEGEGKKYASFAKKLRKAAKECGEYAYLFETSAALCSTLAIKAEIGLRTREAYKAKDMEMLDAVIEDYKKMIKRTEQFYYAFRYQWYKENKPHGFDVQDIRLGGLIRRMISCKERLTDYRNGVITSIPELEEENTAVYGKETYCNSWSKTVSANVMG